MSQEFIRQLPGASRHLGSHRMLVDRFHIDLPLLILVSLIAVMGLFVLYSGIDQQIADVRRQGIRLLVGLVVMIGLAQVNPFFYRRWSWLIYAFGLLCLFAVIGFGVGAKGAQRWLDLPGLPQFQPSELMKLAVPMILASFLADRPLPPGIVNVFAALVILLVPAGLIGVQPDLGTALLVFLAGASVIFLAGLSWRLIGFCIAAGVMLIPLFWHFVMHDYQKQRVLTFLDPQRDPLGAGWNIIQSTTAIGSGGLAGKGWLNGTQSHLDFLPESHTDFIVAVLAEEFGFLGVLVLVSIYLMIVLRCLWIANGAGNTYGRLLVGSIGITFFVYVFVNIGMVSGILPVVGVPLPLTSYGGTSVITLMAGFGVVMSVHTHKKMLSL